MKLSRVLTLSFGPVLLVPFFAVGAQTPASPVKPVTHSCTIDKATPDAGEIALAKRDYIAALAFYRETVSNTPDSVDARLGLVRALIGEDKSADATKEAADAVAKFPKSALAEVAVGEAAFRAADFDASSKAALAAYTIDPCDARGMDLMATLFNVTAHFAGAARLLKNAHVLRPNDELILRDWIDSLPRKQRQEELEKYLVASNSAISARDREDAQLDLDHLKAHHAGECRITSKNPTVKVPFAPLYEDAVTVKAYGLNAAFNGKMRRLQIDTGASGIVLSASAASRLNLTPEYKLHTYGVGDEGEVGSYLTHVSSITIGDVQISDCLVDVLEKPKGGDRLDVDGLIGLDVFRRWLATLDYPNRQLVLEPLALRPATPGQPEEDVEADLPHDAYIAPSMQNWTHIIRIGHDILLPSILNNGPLHYMIMDTGAGESSLSLAFARETGKAHRDTDVEFRGISGKVKEVYRLDNATLQFDRTRVPSSSYYAFDLTKLSHNEGTEVSGFVGLPTLSRLTLTVDYRDNLMQMKYDPNHDPINYVNPR